MPKHCVTITYRSVEINLHVFYLSALLLKEYRMNINKWSFVSCVLYILATSRRHLPCVINPDPINLSC